MPDRTFLEIIAGDAADAPELEITIWEPGFIPNVGDAIVVTDGQEPEQNGTWQVTSRAFYLGRATYGNRTMEEWGCRVQVARHTEE